MIGKYLNRYGYTDINPIGKIIGVTGKQTVIVKRVQSSDNKTTMEFVPGGFSAVCVNQYAQEYDFFETDETFKLRLSKSLLRSVRVEDQPKKFYDYNF